jgi:hypothetical protein
LKTGKFKPVYSFDRLGKGLEILGALWARETTVEMMNQHWMAVWYALHGGHWSKAAQTAGVHRNAFYYFRAKWESASLFLGRERWRNVEGGDRKFHEKFHAFWGETGLNPRLSLRENTGLIGLWKTGFPPKMLGAGLVLWAHREGKTRQWILDKWGITNRNSYGLRLGRYAKANRETSQWFGPLKPGPEDWRPRVTLGRPRIEKGAGGREKP